MKLRILIVTCVFSLASTAWGGTSYITLGNFSCSPDVNPNVTCCDIILLDDNTGICANGTSVGLLCDSDLAAGPQCPGGGTICSASSSGTAHPKAAAVCDNGESVFIETVFPAAASENWALSMRVGASWLGDGNQACFDVLDSATEAAPFGLGFEGPNKPVSATAPGAWLSAKAAAFYKPWSDNAGAICGDTGCDDFVYMLKITRNDANGCASPIDKASALIYDMTLFWP